MPCPDLGQRYTVKIASIEATVPQKCVRCLSDEVPYERPQVYRRSDKTVERVVALQWPYCSNCYKRIAPLDRAQSHMTWVGMSQMGLILYGVGASMGYYDLWMPSIGILVALVFTYGRLSKRARKFKYLEWAHIQDVYKGGKGASMRFRSKAYADLFAKENRSDDKILGDSQNKYSNGDSE